MRNYRVFFPCLGGSQISICVNAVDKGRAIYKAREIIEARGIQLPPLPEQWAKVIEENCYDEESST